MKPYLSIIFVFLLQNIIFAQNNFPVNYLTTDDEWFDDAIQMNDSTILISGTQIRELNGQKIFRTFIRRIDSKGNLISNKLLTDYPEFTYFSRLILEGNTIYAFGVKQSNSGNENVIVKYDLNFNKLSEQHLMKDSLKGIYEVQDVLQFDSLYYLINYNRHKNQSFPSFSVLKINRNLDSLDSFCSYPYTGIVYGGLMNKNNANFRVFTFLYYNIGWGQSVYFDKDLNLKRVDSLPRLLHQFNDALWVSDTTFLVTGMLANNMNKPYEPLDWDLGIVLMDTNINRIHYKYQKRVGTEDGPGWSNNIIKSEDNGYYFTGTVNRIFSTYDTSYVVLSKIDSNFNLIWEKRFTDSVNSYDVAGIYPLLDSSILLLVWRYENHINISRDAYAYKISKDGEVLSITKISTPKIKAHLYPNPTTTTLTLRLQAPGQTIATLKIYNALGQQVMELKPKAAEIKIDVRKLKSGVYFVEGFTRKGERFEGKFVKE